MELYPSCITCVMNNVLHVSRRVLPDDDTRFELLREITRRIDGELHRHSSAPVLTEIAFSVLREFSGVADPFEKIKQEFNERMLQARDHYRKLIEDSPDPLHAALVAAGAANLIDFGAFRNVSGEQAAETLRHHMEHTSLSERTYADFADALGKERKILILSDNAGEIVLDTILVDVLQNRFPGMDVTCAVRGGPILNDVTLEDARQVGLARQCRVISTGLAVPGTIPERSTREFQTVWEKAPVILAKGVGNFESAPFGDDRIFFLFIIKCETLSRLTESAEGTLIFQKGRGSLLADTSDAASSRN
ncbi:MAG: damage-control phosphatase ARMT1 family protein [Thermovirgaceae bacterium]